MVNYLFVDGASLDSAAAAVSERYFGGIKVPVDYSKLRFLGSPNFSTVFYYDALPIRQEGETDAAWQTRTEAKRELLDRLALTDGVRVYEGDVRRSAARGRGNEQKKVDVAIAVDMLTHAFRRNMAKAALLTSDLDFRPLLEALEREGMPVTLFHSGQASRDLLTAAHTRQPIDIKTVLKIVTTEFNLSWPYPTEHPGMISPPQLYMQLSQLTDSGVEWALMQESDGRFTACWKRPGTLWLRVTHPNADFVRRWVKDYFGLGVPAKPPFA